MTAVLILGWLTIAALVLIARVDYRRPPRLSTDTAPCAEANKRIRVPRAPSPNAVFRAPPLPEPVFVNPE